MLFDDRLATVLQMQTGSERAASTQFRQLLDLVGSAPGGADEDLLEAAYGRLGVLSQEIGEDRRALMVREPGLRLRNPELVSFLAGQELPVATAALASARLDEKQWDALIPALPVPVRGLLRHRRDIPETTRSLLERLGVKDLVIDGPASPVPANDQSTSDDDIFELDEALEIEEEQSGIGALVRRIEAFQRARKSGGPVPQDSPRLPLGEEPVDNARHRAAFDFSTDAEGRIDWADPALAPMTVGILLSSQQSGLPAEAGANVIAAMRSRQPIRNGRVHLRGAPAIEGDWRVDAAPHFSIPGGRFAGYRGRMRRPIEEQADIAAPVESDADRIREMLHELKTPVNAIQGFAEIIQQQLFGPTPNEYRALAASIAGDAARMLAGFDELDRLAKLEGGAIELDEGTSDFREIVTATCIQLDGVLRPRSAGLELEAPVTPCPVTLADTDAEQLAWRILATLAAVVSPGEALRLTLAQDSGDLVLTIDLPATIAEQDNIFDSSIPAQSHTVSAGMFGSGFAMRLARAEARATGGELKRDGDLLRLNLPLARELEDA